MLESQFLCKTDLDKFASDIATQQFERPALNGLLSHLGLAVSEDLDHVLPSEGIEQLLAGALHLLVDVDLGQLELTAEVEVLHVLLALLDGSLTL